MSCIACWGCEGREHTGVPVENVGSSGDVQVVSVAVHNIKTEQETAAEMVLGETGSSEMKDPPQAFEPDPVRAPSPKTSPREGETAPGAEFTIDITKPPEGLQLRLAEAALSSFPCIVRDTGDGPLKGKLERYDRILGINNVTGSLAKMAEEIAQSTELSIKVRKGKPYSVNVKKEPNESLGLTIEAIGADTTQASDGFASHEGFFIVTGIVEGSAIDKLNQMYADRCIRANDWVVEVNSVTGCAPMLEQIKTKTELRLKFVRQFKSNELAG